MIKNKMIRSKKMIKVKINKNNKIKNKNKIKIKNKTNNSKITIKKLLENIMKNLSMILKEPVDIIKIIDIKLIIEEVLVSDIQKGDILIIIIINEQQKKQIKN